MPVSQGSEVSDSRSSAIVVHAMMHETGANEGDSLESVEQQSRKKPEN